MVPAIPTSRLESPLLARDGGDSAAGGFPGKQPWFSALLASDVLEGDGYMFAGMFMVAAVGHNSSSWLRKQRGWLSA